jgi:hypothetical protein
MSKVEYESAKKMNEILPRSAKRARFSQYDSRSFVVPLSFGSLFVLVSKVTESGGFDVPPLPGRHMRADAAMLEKVQVYALLGCRGRHCRWRRLQVKEQI